jgi:CheY-like chemotaxis protein
MSATILIAVPDLIFRSKIAAAARQAGHETVAASTADAVLERAATHRPALVVVDLGDDRVDPPATIRRLKAAPDLDGVRVIGFFSHVRTDLRDAAREAGCDRVMPRSAFVANLAGLLESLGEA